MLNLASLKWAAPRLQYKEKLGSTAYVVTPHLRQFLAQILSHIMGLVLLWPFLFPSQVLYFA